MYGFNLGIFIQTIAAAFAPDTGLFKAAGRELRAAGDSGIHPQSARFQIAEALDRFIQIRRPDAGRQPVAGVIGNADRLFIAVEWGDAEHRAEDLFAENGHFRGHIIENGGFDKQPIPGGNRVAAGEQGGTLIFSLFDIAEHGLVVLLSNNRANLGVFIQRIAAAYFLRAFNQLLAEILMDRTFNQ